MGSENKLPVSVFCPNSAECRQLKKAISENFRHPQQSYRLCNLSKRVREHSYTNVLLRQRLMYHMSQENKTILLLQKSSLITRLYLLFRAPEWSKNLGHRSHVTF